MIYIMQGFLNGVVRISEPTIYSIMWRNVKYYTSRLRNREDNRRTAELINDQMVLARGGIFKSIFMGAKSTDRASMDKDNNINKSLSASISIADP